MEEDKGSDPHNFVSVSRYTLPTLPETIYSQVSYITDAEGTTAGYMVAVGEDESTHPNIKNLDELKSVDGGVLNLGLCEIDAEVSV
jgi:hypothetical protein